jgi:hypothetical protein
MYFFKRGGWEVQFLEADLKTGLPRKLTFTDPEKIRELARRGEAWGTRTFSRSWLEIFQAAGSTNGAVDPPID